MEWVDGAPDKTPWQFTRYDGTKVDMDPKDWPVGVLLEVKRESISKHEKSNIFLVGHVNPKGGLCDDCAYDWEPEDIIRHKVVWTEGDCEERPVYHPTDE